MDTFILAAFGLLFGGVGGWLLWSEWQFFRRAIRIPGVVVSYEERRGHKGERVYAPVAAFELDGERRQVTGSIYSSGKPKMGKQCVIGVDPYNLDKARIYSKWNYIFSGLFLIIGIGLLVGAVVSCFA